MTESNTTPFPSHLITQDVEEKRKLYNQWLQRYQNLLGKGFITQEESQQLADSALGAILLPLDRLVHNGVNEWPGLADWRLAEFPDQTRQWVRHLTPLGRRCFYLESLESQYRLECVVNAVQEPPSPPPSPPAYKQT